MSEDFDSEELRCKPEEDMDCCVSIPYDKTHIKFIQEVIHAAKIVGCAVDVEIDEGGVDSQESVFRLLCSKKDDPVLWELVDFVSLNKDATDEALLNCWVRAGGAPRK